MVFFFYILRTGTAEPVHKTLSHMRHKTEKRSWCPVHSEHLLPDFQILLGSTCSTANSRPGSSRLALGARAGGATRPSAHPSRTAAPPRQPPQSAAESIAAFGSHNSRIYVKMRPKNTGANGRERLYSANKNTIQVMQSKMAASISPEVFVCKAEALAISFTTITKGKGEITALFQHGFLPACTTHPSLYQKV